ncbi:UspA family protein [Gracilibacillus halophilus YIM-C55.5]|uniref:Universal stress protein n=1 Tax=Gracilibacillus halophilus YIM-C55.5 TaxID=1308866 RepID=N4W909_9BACI|nr:universal stress protein [Gracilibacillus halophilus]ENH96783.1 UspA family protein [Gracilibacillus halophilus YIM-C55.5]
MYQKILLATDGSEHSQRAAENAVHITKTNEDAELEIVYVIDAKKAKTDVLNHWNSSDVNDIRKQQMKIARKLAEEANVTYHVNILHGEPGPTIVDYANQHDFDMVIIGSRGLNSLQEFVLGSVSHKVAKRVDCPVLIVK